MQTVGIMTTEERVECAKAYFRQGFNCSQSVVLAFKDVCGLDEKALGRIAAGLGGGVGRMREVCGCVCGMAMLSGFITEHKRVDDKELPPAPYEQKKAAYALTQKMASDFKKETGSIVCRELLGLSRDQDSPLPSADSGSGASSEAPLSPVPEHRTADYYKKRPCEQMVALAARIVSEKLLNSHFEKNPE